MSSIIPKKRPLSLKRQTLRVLTEQDLDHAQGGALPTTYDSDSIVMCGCNSQTQNADGGGDGGSQYADGGWGSDGGWGGGDGGWGGGDGGWGGDGGDGGFG